MTTNTDKVTLITGASRGIGAATALALAEQGHHICINYVRSDDAAQQVKTQVEQLGVKALVVKADVADETQVTQLFQTIDRHLGPLTGLVNNAAILKTQSLLVDMDAARINQMLRANITSAFLCAKEAVKRMSTRLGGSGGAIVNVSSAASRLGAPFEYIDYAATKGAMDSLTKGLSVEVAKEGIRVNSVRPGFIYTDMHADGGEPDRIARVTPNIPMGRGGQPQEIANAIAWLLSDDASYCTGTFVEVAGGR